MSFKKLQESLGLMNKSLAAGDSDKDGKIAAAAAEGAAAGAAAEAGAAAGGEGGAQAAAGSAGTTAGKGADADPSLEEGEGKGKAVVLGKSFGVEGADGVEYEAFDATDLLKSMSARLETTEAGLKSTEAQAVAVIGQAVEVIAAQGSVIATLKKSLGEQGASLAGQADLIKSLRSDLDTLRNEPAGRKSVASPAQISAASPLAKSLNGGEGGAPGMAPQEFLAKCLTLQKTGRVSLQECAMAEAAIGSGVPVDPAIVTKVFSSQ